MPDCLLEVQAGFANERAAEGAQIRQQGLIDWGLAQEQIPEGDVQAVGDLLCLSEGRLPFAIFPALKLFGLDACHVGRCTDVKTDTVTCPAQHRRVDQSVRGAIQRF